jgi:hypothetical protein
MTDKAPTFQATNVSPVLTTLTTAAPLAKQHIPDSPTAVISFSLTLFPAGNTCRYSPAYQETAGPQPRRRQKDLADPGRVQLPIAAIWFGSASVTVLTGETRAAPPSHSSACGQRNPSPRLARLRNVSGGAFVPIAGRCCFWSMPVKQRSNSALSNKRRRVIGQPTWLGSMSHGS